MRTSFWAGTLACMLALPANNALGQSFYGDILLKPLDGEKMELVQKFGMVDKAGRQWEAPAGYKTDGASIPRALWTVVGSPFTGKYLKASVLHDFYCDLKSRSWQDVHQLFYDAMIADGVGPTQAKIMYAAVYRFGPRWVVDKFFNCPPGLRCGSRSPSYVDFIKLQPKTDVEEMEKLKALIADKDMSLEEIREIGNQAFKKGAAYKAEYRIGKTSGPVSYKQETVENLFFSLSRSDREFDPGLRERFKWAPERKPD